MSTTKVNYSTVNNLTCCVIMFEINQLVVYAHLCYCQVCRHSYAIPLSYIITSLSYKRSYNLTMFVCNKTRYVGYD